ncbi:MAG: hypothetical protein MUP53_03485 [Bacteroidales bacterium]|nr:hypothetical protein [Bacteroidales bacterium]
MLKRGNKVLWNILFFAAVIFWFSSCRHEAVLDQNLPEICFEREVLPIFSNSCALAGCHDATGESGYILNNYIDISHAVVAGNPEQSPVYKAIIISFGEGRMPPDKPLSLENRTLIRLWILQGARLTSCQDPSGEEPGYVNPRACFQRDILPVLVSSCAITGCHDAASHKEGYTFVGYSTTMAAVKPGNPSESKLYKVITDANVEDIMPPPPMARLSSAVIDSIAAWIRYGAPDEFCGEVCDTLNPVTYSAIIWPVIQTSCLGCHGGTNPGGGVMLRNYAEVASIASSGVLMNALKGLGVPKMPPAGSLSTCRIRQFDLWIKSGYPNN